MRGTTLVELLVVLFILGVMAGASAFALAGLRPSAEKDRSERFGRARAQAIRGGQAITVTGDSGNTIRFLPDGRALGPGVDPFTGEMLHAAR